MDWQDGSPTAPTSPKVVVLSILIAVVTFVLDLAAPFGISGGIPYVALVLAGLWYQDRSAVLFLATAGSILTILAFFLSPIGGATWIVLTNRALALSAIWITSIVLWLSWNKRTTTVPQTGNIAKSNLLRKRDLLFVSTLIIIVLISSWGVLSHIEGGAKNDLKKIITFCFEFGPSEYSQSIGGTQKGSPGLDYSYTGLRSSFGFGEITI